MKKYFFYPEKYSAPPSQNAEKGSDLVCDLDPFFKESYLDLIKITFLQNNLDLIQITEKSDLPILCFMIQKFYLVVVMSLAFSFLT